MPGGGRDRRAVADGVQLRTQMARAAPPAFAGHPSSRAGTWSRGAMTGMGSRRTSAGRFRSRRGDLRVRLEAATRASGDRVEARAIPPGRALSVPMEAGAISSSTRGRRHGDPRDLGRVPVRRFRRAYQTIAQATSSDGSSRPRAGGPRHGSHVRRRLPERLLLRLPQRHSRTPAWRLTHRCCRPTTARSSRQVASRRATRR